MPKLRSTYDGRLIYKTSYEELQAFLTCNSPISPSSPHLSPFRSSPFPLPPFSSKKGKGSPYSITERRVPELIPVLGSQPAGDVNHKPDGIGCRYFPPGQQLPQQPLRGLLPILLLGEQRHDGREQFA